MLLLVIVALSVRVLSPGLERTLKTFMFVGAFCFSISILSQLIPQRGQYPVHFKVLPHDLYVNGSEVMAPPEIEVEGTPVGLDRTYIVKSEVTATINVNEAFQEAKRAAAMLVAAGGTIDEQSNALGLIKARVDNAVGTLSGLPAIIDKSCPGGSSGVSPSSNIRVIAAANDVIGDINAILREAEVALRPRR